MRWFVAISLFLASACASPTKVDRPDIERPMGRAANTATAVVEAAPAAGKCAHDATMFRCVRYLKNYDGDTITIQIPDVHPLLGDAIAVRVRGIDTPEVKGKTQCERDRAIEARDVVAAVLSKARRIDLKDIGRDKYFRIDADVVADGKSIRDVLLERKLAYRYVGGTKRDVDWCSRPASSPADAAH